MRNNLYLFQLILETLTLFFHLILLCARFLPYIFITIIPIIIINVDYSYNKHNTDINNSIKSYININWIYWEALLKNLINWEWLYEGEGLPGIFRLR